VNIETFARRFKAKLDRQNLYKGMKVEPLPQDQLDAIFSYPHPAVVGRELPDDPELFEMFDRMNTRNKQ